MSLEPQYFYGGGPSSLYGTGGCAPINTHCAVGTSEYQHMVYGNHFEPSNEHDYIGHDSNQDICLADFNNQASSLEMNLQRLLNGNQRGVPLEDKYRSPLENLLDSYSTRSESARSPMIDSYSSRAEPATSYSRNRYDSLSYSSQESFADLPESYAYPVKPQAYHNQSYPNQGSPYHEAMLNSAAPINDCFDMGSLAHPSNFEEQQFPLRNGFGSRRNSGSSGNFPRSAASVEHLRTQQQQCEAALYKTSYDQIERRDNSRRVYSRHNSESGSSLGLTDISTRLEATLSAVRDSSTWTPLGASIDERNSKSPSPERNLCARDFNPIETFNFSSEDEDDSFRQAKSNSFRHGSHKMSLFSNNPCSRQFSDADIPPEIPLPAPSKPEPRRTFASWSQIVRTTSSKPGPTVSTQTVSSSPPRSESPSPPSTRVPSPSTSAATSTEFHRGPKVDPRWPVAQQLFLGPIPVSVTWDEIRNTFYNKVARHQILHTYVQSKPVNDVVYGQIVFDKASLASKILKEGPIKVSGHVINVTSMKEKAKMEKRR